MLQRFQARHGLLPDGILGKDTLAALNEPIAARVVQIVLSLERLRWLPDFAAGPLIAINIPSFRLWAFADAPGAGSAALSMPVVVGRAMRNETPVFIGEMRYVEFSPYWNVPPSILRNELLPRLDKDPSYLEREDMEIVGTRGDGPAIAADAGAGIAALRSGDAAPAPAPGPEERAGRRQVRAAQHHGHLPARDAGARVVRPRASATSATAASACATRRRCVVRASRPPGVDGRRRSRQRWRPA